MFESLIESRRCAQRTWRPAAFGIALGLHLCVVAVIVAGNHFRVPPTSEPPLHASFLQFAPPAAPPGPAASAVTAELSAAALEPSKVLPQPDAWTVQPIPTELMQPQMTPASILTDPVPEAPPAAADGGVKPGVPGGVRGGVPGGVRGGVPGGALVGLMSRVRPLWVGGAVSAPVVVSRVLPGYPMMARSARVEGEVQLEAVIRRDGTVGDVKVVRGLPMGCTEAAIEALKHWRFRPGEYKGVPVDVYFTLAVDFTLKE